jgi:stearoyl-CoA desaturase (delta-9 desaturase)
MSSISGTPNAGLPVEPAATIPPQPIRPLSRADGAVATSRTVSAVYWGIHLSCFLALLTGVSTRDLWLLAATLSIRLFGITGGYHRYFAHKAFKTSRPFQFVLALLGATATQKGPLWWAGLHRRHHAYTDRAGDVHSPKEGFWYAHQGWIFDPRWTATPEEQIRDFSRFPELVWLNRYHVVPPLLLALACFAIGGLSGVIWGYSISTTILWHSTYSVNSLAHRWGTRRYDTPDTSRNNLLISLLTFGEGWHNNHHHYMASARQGFFWWEIDVTYYLLRGLAAVGVVWDLREPPAAVRDPESRRALREAA